MSNPYQTRDDEGRFSSTNGGTGKNSLNIKTGNKNLDVKIPRKVIKTASIVSTAAHLIPAHWAEIIAPGFGAATVHGVRKIGFFGTGDAHTDRQMFLTFKKG